MTNDYAYVALAKNIRHLIDYYLRMF